MWLDTDLKTLNERIKWNKKRPLLDKKNNGHHLKENSSVHVPF